VLHVSVAPSGDQLLISLLVTAREQTTWFGFGTRATVFEAFATIGGRPAASKAGKVIRDAPPTMAVTIPPATPAPKSISPA
jgi:hypothetical protein